MKHSKAPLVFLLVLVLVAGCVRGYSPTPIADANVRFRSVPLTEVLIQMRNMQYTPDIVRIKPHQALMITFDNTDTVNHSFVISDVAEPIHLFVSPGRRIATSLFFDAPGVFNFVCSQEGHKAAGMVGRIVVE